MTVSRRLQVGMALLVALGTLMLGLGQASPTLPLLAIFASGTSLVFTDILGWFRLHRLVANLAAVAAAVFSLWNFFRDNSQEQLLAIASLLSILLIILLYQEKTHRLYWQLSVLSLLQVVVAAALNLGLIFGLLLVVYTLVAVTTLTLFFLEREAARLIAAEAGAAVKHKKHEFMAWSSMTEKSSRRDRNWMFFFASPVAFQTIERASLDRPMLQGGLVSSVTSLCCTTLIFALILFYSVPRLSSSSWHGPTLAGQRTSGFSPQITFDEMGEILQNHDLVLRAEFYEAGTGSPYLVEEPYFRGATLVDYEFDGESAQWAQTFATNQRGARRLRPTVNVENMVRQDITFASSGITPDATGDPPSLFSTYPIYPLADTPRSLRYDQRTGQLFRAYSDDASQSIQYRYTLGTTAFRQGRTASISPHTGAPLDEGSRRRLMRFDPHRHGGLRDVAAGVLAAAGRSSSNSSSKALALQSHFLDPYPFTLGSEVARPYSYTLRPADAQRQLELDPLEDFVVNHRSGHCEYFASALVMMLRSQGVPARIALGYKGGEFNTLGNYWQVRQSNAHAWVEVYLEPDEVPPDALVPGESNAAGGWLLLDPTPAADLEGSPIRSTGIWGRLFDLADYAQFLWSDYVVGLNSETQRRTLYPPVDPETPGSFADLINPGKWREFFAAASQSVGIDPRAWLRGEWFSWRAGLAAMILCLVLVGLAKLFSILIGRLGRHHGKRRGAEQTRRVPTVEFYERLAALMARLGMERRPTQTQQEFAVAAAARLRNLEFGVDASLCPAQIVDFFYRVRFGSATLDKHETDQIEQALSTLERNVSV